jgi:deoxyribonuclease-4
MVKPLLGTHISVAGGLFNAFPRAESIGCATMQIFVKNANQWFAKPLSESETATFREHASASSVRPVIAHAAYLINLCAVNPDTLNKSRSAYEDELRRCESLGVSALVFHPGAHMGAGEEEGLARIAESLNIIHDRTPGFTVKTTLETTAGQGTALGHTFAHLQAIIEKVEQKDRVAVCMDTCHMFTAGYSVGTAEGWDALMRQFDETVGLARLAAIHVNDSKKPFGSRLDRHHHIGMGEIGLEGFRPMMNDPRLSSVPKILETEKSEDMHEDVENMDRLRSLLVQPPL